MRNLLVLGLAVSLVAAPVLPPVWAAPRAVTPTIEEVTITLAEPGTAGSQAPAATPDSDVSETGGPATEPVPTESPEATPPEQPTVAPTEEASAAGSVTLVTPPIPVGEAVSVGASWSTVEAPVPPEVEVRSRVGSGWGDWTRLDRVEEGPDPDTAEGQAAVQGATAPLWVGDDVDAVQVRVTGRADTLPGDLDLALVDPGRSPADGLPARPAASADAATAVPNIISRAQWGADESLRRCGPSYNSTIKAAVLHHTAGPNTYASVADAMRQLRSDYAYHTQQLGWCDLGYNFVVDKWGNIYEGRAGGVDRPVVGAHAGGFNKDTFGVSMLGTFTSASPPLAMQRAVAEVIGWKLSVYRLNPHGSTTLVSAGGGTSRYPTGQAVNLPVVMGHRDVGSTACPGNAGYATLAGIRSNAAIATGGAALVRALYADKMGRGPDNAGLRSWTAALVGGAGSRAVARGFSTSTEYRLLSIDMAYQQVLGRGPDPIGRENWLTYLRNGSLRIDQIRPILMESEEFYYRGGSSDAAFVDNIYRAALGRGAAPHEVSVWGDIRQRYGPRAVISGVWGSREAAKRRVVQEYQYYLGRGAGPSEQEAWADVVLGLGDERLREELVVSGEYYYRAGVRFP